MPDMLSLDQTSRPSVGRSGASTASQRRSAVANRLCFVVNHSAAGGVGELWTDLAHAFNEKGYATSLVAFWPLENAARATHGAVPWSHIAPAKPRSAAEFLRFYRALVEYFRAERPDRIVTAMPAANLLIPLAAGMADHRIEVVTTHHTPADTLDGIAGRLDRYARLMPNVRSAVSVSQAVARSYAPAGARLSAKQRVIHNALPPRIEHQLADLRCERERSYRRGERLHVVALGRLALQKNYEVLIRAAKRLGNVEISIVGAGPEEQRLRDLVRQTGVDDRVFFRGFLPRDEALRIVANADIFVQMSRFEGHSLALIEAAKLGLPLIVSNIPVQVEGITAENGDLCGIALDMDDDQGLAGWIERLAADDVLYAKASRLAEIIARESSFDRMIAAYERLLAARPDSGEYR